MFINFKQFMWIVVASSVVLNEGLFVFNMNKIDLYANSRVVRRKY